MHYILYSINFFKLNYSKVIYFNFNHNYFLFNNITCINIIINNGLYILYSIPTVLVCNYHVTEMLVYDLKRKLTITIYTTFI